MLADRGAMGICLSRREHDTIFWGKQINSSVINFDGSRPYKNGILSEYRERTVEVKELPCNDWGLYQMHGNVSEWCEDWYAEYSEGAVVNPQGPEMGDYRLLRDGSWLDYIQSCRSAARFFGFNDPHVQIYRIGFRLVRSH